MSFETQRVDFNVEEFTRIVEQKGYNLFHEVSLPCNCSVAAKQADPLCTVCHGTGWRYLKGNNIKGVITGITNDVEFTAYGTNKTGIAFLTVLAKNRVSFRDRLTLIDSRIVYSEVIKRGGKTKYPVVGVELLADLTKEYLPTTDYTLVGETLTWAMTTDTPPVSKEPASYSIRYLARPRYLVLGFPNITRITGVKFKQATISEVELPIRAMIKLEFRVEESEL